MPHNCKQSREAILASTERIPFGPRDRDNLSAHLRIARRRGLDLALDPGWGEGMDEAVASGAVLLQSKVLGARFMLVNVPGTGVCPEKRTRVFTFYSPLNRDEWIPLVDHGGLIPALSVITNMYGYVGKAESEALPDGQWNATVPALWMSACSGERSRQDEAAPAFTMETRREAG